MYNPTKWEDHVSDPQNEFFLEKIEGNRYKIIPCGEKIQKGTLLSAENFNKNERGTAETVIALCSMLQMFMLMKDEQENYAFFFTEEHECSMESFKNTTGYSLVQSIEYSFLEKHVRKNTEYTAIPIITAINTYTPNKNSEKPYLTNPAIVVEEKKTTGLRATFFCPDTDSEIESYSCKFLIIGGI